MWGRCSASSAKPFGNTLRRRSLVAVACWIIVASGFSRMSMAVTEASAAIARLVPRASMARAHAIDHLSQSRLEDVAVIVLSLRCVLVRLCCIAYRELDRNVESISACDQ